jgi:O-antigen/teichoic acid export membrane protein
VKNLWSSPTLRTVALYGISGLAFAAANLILARVLPTAEYGLFTLVIALVNLGHALATGGVDGVVVRRHLKAGPKLLQRSMSAGLIVGLALTTIAGVVYHLTIPMLLVVFVSTVAGGLMMVAGARFQSEERFVISLALVQSPNLVLILAALTVVLSNEKGAWLPLLISALGFVLAASTGWWLLLSGRSVGPPPRTEVPLERCSFLCWLQCGRSAPDPTRPPHYTPSALGP